MKNQASDDLIEDLCRAMTLLRTEEEAFKFLKDLTTPSEMSALAERWRIAIRLHEGELSYRAIAAETGASTTTVARVARFLNDEPYDGYRRLLPRFAKQKTSQRTKT